MNTHVHLITFEKLGSFAQTNLLFSQNFVEHLYVFDVRCLKKGLMPQQRMLIAGDWHQTIKAIQEKPLLAQNGT